ncbi:MAG: formate dehydrogenase subunit alpha [Chloroflexota bacterium]|nr:formate dehydrogenase subunit alpha [Chloroflexota bacterium]
MAKVNITINDRQVVAEAGQTVLEAATEAGIEIPTLCYHPALPPEAVCRVCVVEIEGQRTLQPSCTFPVSEGMEIKTHSPRVVEARRVALELLISDCPMDCTTCEMNGNCELQDLCYEYGVNPEEARFAGEKHEYPIDDSNPFIERDYNKCILCRRCVRACEYMNGVEAIGSLWRGFETKIGTAFDAGLQDSPCEFCGMCVEVCPTGALIPIERKGKGREWEFRHVQTTCPYCGVGCQLDLNIKDNRIVQVRSVWDGPANHGLTCVKGRFGFDFNESPDRLTRPLIKKDGQFVEATWDEALHLVASRLSEIKEKHGSDAIGVLSSAKCTNEENYAMQKFARAVIGTNNIDHCARLCHAPTVTGLVTAFGSGAMTNSFDDIAEEAEIYFIIGSNTTEQHPVLGMRIRQEVKERDAKLIVCDPREIPIADFADLHICQKPGTDVALLNGIMNVLITEELYDEDFVEGRTENFEELKETVLKYPPERAAEICGITPDEIVEAAHLLAENRPGALLYAMGITQHTCGHQNVLSTANLQMLLGNMGLPGGGVNPLRGQNNVQGACDLGALVNVYPGYQKVTDPAAREKFEQAWGVKLSPKVGLTVVEMINAAETGEVKAMYIMGENPMMSDPDIKHVEECLKSLDFLVVQDIFLTETAQLADVVLPGVSGFEKDGTYTNSERRIQMVHKAVDPPGEARQDWWIVGEVARRIGYDGLTYSSPKEIMDEAAPLTPIYGGISHDRLDTQGLQWPCPSPDHPGTPILHVGKFARGLGHFTGVEWQPPAEEPDEEYPLILTTGRVLYHWHTGTLTRRSKGLDAIYPEAVVELNTQDAAKLGIADGQIVKVTSRRGEVTAKVQVSDKPKPGVVFMPWHFAEAAANKLTIAALDPTSKIPELKVCAVKVEAA